MEKERRGPAGVLFLFRLGLGAPDHGLTLKTASDLLAERQGKPETRAVGNALPEVVPFRCRPLVVAVRDRDAPDRPRVPGESVTAPEADEPSPKPLHGLLP